MKETKGNDSKTVSQWQKINIDNIYLPVHKIHRVHKVMINSKILY